MANSKELKAKVSLDVRDAESKLRRLNTLINSLNRSVKSATKVEGGVDKTIAQYDKLAMQQRRLALQEERLALQKEKFKSQETAQLLRVEQIEQNRLAREQATVDKMLQKEMDALHKKQQAKWNAFQKEQAAYEKQLAKEREIQRQAECVNAEWRKTHPILTKIGDRLGINKSKTADWGKSVNNVVTAFNDKLKGSNNILGGIWQRLKGIAATYLGIMGTKAVVDTTDLLVGAQNRLNYVAAGQLGDKGYNSDGTYSNATINATQDAMDKMYVSSQKVRTSYQDMISNVSKTMSLAGDAFDGNIDNAIRFQEIMAEAYTVGGASAQEMSSSMYQLTQALGSGVLQGDELRSLREGAPLAYKAIEEFAQGVLKTSDSLKDLASDGMITSEMVVAAIMNEGKALDKAFAQTRQTFGQTLDQIKNSALYAFQPVMEALTDMLNQAVENGMVEKFEKAFTNVAKGLLITFKLIEKAITWIADNWNWLQHVVLGAIALMITWTLIKMGISVWAAYIEAQAWLTANGIALMSVLKLVGAIAIVLMAVMALIYVIYLWKQGAIDTCTAIGLALLAVAAIAFVIFGWQVALIIALIGLVVMFLDVVCGVGWVILTFIGNLIQSILNILAVMFTLIIGATVNAVIAICNTVAGILNVIGAVCTNIDIMWGNMCSSMSSWFWNAIADMLEGCEWLVNALNKVAEFFDKDTISIEGIRAKADKATADKRELVDIGEAWSEGWNKFEYADLDYMANAASTTFGTGLEDWSITDAYNKGSSFGSSIMDSVNKWGSKFQKQADKENEIKNQQDKLKTDTSWLDDLGKKLGLDFGGMGDFPKEGVGSSYDPDYKKILDSIDGNTGNLADSMELTQEDLEYMRRIADMEWKKEYTTAEIKVEMTNHNNVDKEFDLRTIAIGLRDMVEEEMFAIANGVYA